MNAIRTLSAVILVASGAAALAQTSVKPTSNTAPPSPTEVALIDHAGAGLQYDKFPTGERLYISEADPLGKSACNSGCDTAWLPLLAPADAHTVGSWTVVVRDDGRRQWALAGKPVYTRYHNIYSTAPGWRLLSEDLARAMTGR